MASFGPLIGLSSCVAFRDGWAYHEVKNQYHEAVLSCTGGLALSVPALADRMDLDAYVAALHGLVLTGSLSNVHPSRYGDPPNPATEPYDIDRDDLTFALLDKATQAGLPLLCICRGFQEANVFFGGTLYPEIHKVPGLGDHRRTQVPTLAEQFDVHHEVEVKDGQWAGWLEAAGVLPANRRVWINSLHGQGVKQLGKNLHVEAVADDGTVEAFSKPDLPGFFWAGQFHPEWDAPNTPQYRVLFEAFGAAARSQQTQQTGQIQQA